MGSDRWWGGGFWKVLDSVEIRVPVHMTRGREARVRISHRAEFKIWVQKLNLGEHRGRCQVSVTIGAD